MLDVYLLPWELRTTWPIVNDMLGLIHTCFFVEYSQTFKLLILMDNPKDLPKDLLFAC